MKTRRKNENYYMKTNCNDKNQKCVNGKGSQILPEGWKLVNLITFVSRIIKIYIFIHYDFYYMVLAHSCAIMYKIKG